ncbi:hypothetical protein Tco_1198921 [Tanacetum coccineum]
MLAIPHLSQVSSMAEIVSKEAQKKSKAGICFRSTSHNKHTLLVPSCFVIFNLEPLSLSSDFVFSFEIFKSFPCMSCHLFHLVILCLDQYAHTMHHLESMLTISLDNLCLDNLDIFKEDL